MFKKNNKQGDQVKQAKVAKTKPEKAKPFKTRLEEYYKFSNAWGADILDSMVTQKNRYKRLFIGTLGFAFLLLLTIMMMMPLREIVPVGIYTDKNGNTYVNTHDFQHKFTHTKQEIRGEIFRYIKMFEGYEAGSFRMSTNYVQAMSAPNIFAKYAKQIGEQNSYVDHLGKDGYRKVTVESINFLNSEKARGVIDPKNTAIVTYTVTTGMYGQKPNDPLKFRALINWEYEGLPKSREEQFLNYDGFTVTGLDVTPVNYDGAKQK